MNRQERVCQWKLSPRGQTMAEYALIVATIAAVAVALVQNAGTIIETLVNHVSTLF
jgi:Flp pilus assembly pilin Flp